NRDKKESGGNFDFFSYEAGFAFAVGALLATVLSLYVWPVILIVSTLGVSWGLTHLIGQTLVKRRRERQQRRTEEDERERRALLARSAASLENEAQSRRRRRKRSV
ncbi:MAG TPA: hypothetical protein VI876_09945, partial [Dehalococcoidia bacterium]|nr:hypothetical protein [Dehalococcoidia bacterium]